jgi:hypothetical protein
MLMCKIDQSQINMTGSVIFFHYSSNILGQLSKLGHKRFHSNIFQLFTVTNKLTDAVSN